MQDWFQDARYGWRMLWKNPALSLIAIVSLALAIGANTAIFTVWNAVLLHGVPVHDPDRLVTLFTEDQGAANSVALGQYLGFSYLNYQDYATNTSRVFSGLYASMGNAAALSYQGQTEQVNLSMVTGNYFQVLGVSAALGRVFTPEETATDGAGAMVVLSQGYFHRRFGGDRSIIGQMITLNGRSFMVAGVTPAGFDGTQTLGGPDLWAPTSMHDALLRGPLKPYFNERRPRLFNVVGRLQPGVTTTQALAALRITASQLEKSFPADNAGQTATLLPLAESNISPNVRGQFVLAFAMMMGVVGLVLLIACANVANLLLARAVSRHREIAVRMAMGASRGRLIRQLLVESMLMGLIAGGVGLLLARAARDLLWAHRPAALANTTLNLSLDAKVLFFALGISLLTGILFGLAPALVSSRLDLIASLKERTSPAVGGHRPLSLRGLLLIGEVGFSLVALIVAGLFLASLRNIQTTSPGFDAAHVASLQFDMAATGFDLTQPGAPDQLVTFERQVVERAQSLPGVTSAALASGTPMAASPFARSYLREGETPRPGQAKTFVSVESVTPRSYFQTMGIPLLEGRDFLPTDVAGSQKVMIVNQTWARHAWPGQDPVGKRVRFTGDTDYTQVVGLAKDSKYFTLSEDPTDFAYFPLAQYPATALGLVVRTAGNPSIVLNAMRDAMHGLNPQLAVRQVEAAEAPIQQSLWMAQMGATLLGALALLATLLAAIGIYGVMSYGVRQRSRELGIRIALGASARQVFGLVMRGGMSLVVIGIGIGIVGALLLARLVATLLFGLQPADPTTFLGYSLLFLAIAGVASFIPARRATRVDPIQTLRND